jgi:transposase
MTTILGIDLGKFKSVFCLFCPKSGEIRYDTLRTNSTEFRAYLTRVKPAMILFEASTAAGWVHDLCVELGLPCEVANPQGEAWQWRKVKRKTDRDDAHKLVRLFLLHELPTVHIPPVKTREYRSLITFRQHLIERRTSMCNYIRAVFQAQGVELPPGRRAWTERACESWSERFARALSRCKEGELWRGIVKIELSQLRQLEKEIAKLEKKLGELAESHPGVALLRTIPGVGPRTAEAVVAFLGDPHRFRTARQVSAYAGLVPRQFQSGTIDRKGKITKRGPAYLRKILVECAWLMRRYNRWGDRLIERISRGQRGRRKPAVVALARKLLVRCWAMLRKNEPWREPDVGLVTSPA